MDKKTLVGLMLFISLLLSIFAVSAANVQINELRTGVRKALLQQYEGIDNPNLNAQETFEFLQFYRNHAESGAETVELTGVMEQYYQKAMAPPGSRNESGNETEDDNETEEHDVPSENIVCGNTITQNTKLNASLECSNNGLMIGADSITLDCDGFTIAGDGDNIGVKISNQNNVVIKNCKITNFDKGIEVTGDNNNIFGNNITQNNIGLFFGSILINAKNNQVHDHTIRGNLEDGVKMYFLGYDNYFWDNTFKDNVQNAYEYLWINNYWNKTTGNYWDDFETNNGYPEEYILGGPGAGIDKKPYGYVPQTQPTGTECLFDYECRELLGQKGYCNENRECDSIECNLPSDGPDCSEDKFCNYHYECQAITDQPPATYIDHFDLGEDFESHNYECHSDTDELACNEPIYNYQCARDEAIKMGCDAPIPEPEYKQHNARFNNDHISFTLEVAQGQDNTLVLKRSSNKGALVPKFRYFINDAEQNLVTDNGWTACGFLQLDIPAEYTSSGNVTVKFMNVNESVENADRENCGSAVICSQDFRYAHAYIWQAGQVPPLPAYNNPRPDECVLDINCDYAYCGEGNVCDAYECTSDTDCYEGYPCWEGQCTALEIITCVADAYCQGIYGEDFECLEGICRPEWYVPPEEDNTTNQTEHECEENGQCEAGYYCADNVCRMIPEEGNETLNSTDVCQKIHITEDYNVEEDITCEAPHLLRGMFVIEGDDIVFDCQDHTIDMLGSYDTAISMKYYGDDFSQVPTGVTIKNCKFTNVGGGAISGSPANDLTVQNCTFEAVNGGVGLAHSSGGIIENNRFTGNKKSVGITDSENVIVDDNDFFDMTGVFVQIAGESSNNQIINNLFLNSDDVPLRSALIHLVGNPNEIGEEPTFSVSGTTIRNNVVVGKAVNEFLLTMVGASEIADNIIIGTNNTGISMDYTKGVEVKGNLIFRPYTGLNKGAGITVLQFNSTGNKISGNKILGFDKGIRFDSLHALTKNYDAANIIQNNIICNEAKTIYSSGYFGNEWGLGQTCTEDTVTIKCEEEADCPATYDCRTGCTYTGTGQKICDTDCSELTCVDIGVCCDSCKYDKPFNYLDETCSGSQVCCFECS